MLFITIYIIAFHSNGAEVGCLAQASAGGNKTCALFLSMLFIFWLTIDCREGVGRLAQARATMCAHLLPVLLTAITTTTGAWIMQHPREICQHPQHNAWSEMLI